MRPDSWFFRTSIIWLPLLCTAVLFALFVAVAKNMSRIRERTHTAVVVLLLMAIILAILFMVVLLIIAIFAISMT